MPGPQMSILNKIALYPTLAYNLVLSKVTGRNWYDRIDETVILGALPLTSVVPELVKKENVRGLVTLNEDYETAYFVHTQQELREMGVTQLRIQTVDYVGTPTQTNILKAIHFIQDSNSRQESVYVHCKAGRTRSATVVACYLMHKHKWSPAQAVEFIKSKRPHIWLRDTQLKSLDIFHAENILEGRQPQEGG